MNSEIQDLADRMFAVNILEDDISDDACEALFHEAKEQILRYGWDAVFSCWRQYLYTKVKTPAEAWSYAAWLYSMGASHYKISDPYEFLGCLYCFLGPNAIDASAVMDFFSAEVLAYSAGRTELLAPNSSPGYIGETDPLILAGKEKWKEKPGGGRL
ncbi:MAG: hypothetical protein LUE27_05345 [Clostridia bacterium]|nr:hypothetical protein [Clostridia bacterium]